LHISNVHVHVATEINREIKAHVQQAVCTVQFMCKLSELKHATFPELQVL